MPGDGVPAAQTPTIACIGWGMTIARGDSLDLCRSAPVTTARRLEPVNRDG
jgi:hypothetical protein